MYKGLLGQRKWRICEGWTIGYSLWTCGREGSLTGHYTNLRPAAIVDRLMTAGPMTDFLFAWAFLHRAQFLMVNNRWKTSQRLKIELVWQLNKHNVHAEETWLKLTGHFVSEQTACGYFPCFVVRWSFVGRSSFVAVCFRNDSYLDSLK